MNDVDRLFEEAIAHIQAAERAVEQLAESPEGGATYNFRASILRTWIRRLHERAVYLAQNDPSEIVERMMIWLTDHPIRKPMTATQINEIMCRALNVSFIYPAHLKRALTSRGYVRKNKAHGTVYIPPTHGL